MALVPDSTSLSLSVNSTLARASRAISGMFVPASHSPDQDLLSGPLRDARLAPRTPMSSADIDVGLLSQLSNIGLKRAKQVTAQTHPELMQAWQAMAQRAGLPKAPQLLIAESDSLNALTVTKDEVTITTGLLKILDLREAVAVLGHELGHVQSDHVKPRLMWGGALGLGGAVIGNEFGRQGGLNFVLTKLGSKVPFFEKAQHYMYGAAKIGAPSSMLGYMAYIGAGAGAGTLVARHFSVHPTELDADAKGAAISGDPQALASALGLLQQHSPRKGIKQTVAQWKSGYPTVEKRVENLQRIAREQGPVDNSVISAVEGAPVQAVAVQPARPSMEVRDVAAAERVALAPQGPALA